VNVTAAPPPGSTPTLATASLARRLTGAGGAAAAIVLTWALLFGPQLFGQVFVIGDAAAFRPFAEFSRERWLRLHERTFWNPYVFAGIPASPSLADPRPQWLPDPLLDLVEAALATPGVPPLAGPLLAHLAGMLATAWLARALWRARPAAMAWAGIAWGLMPNLLVPFAFGHDAQLISASLIPVTLLALERMLAAARPTAALAAALGLGVTLGVQTLTGHPQMVAYGVGLGVAFALVRARHHGRPHRWVAGALAGLYALALAAAVWLPALRYNTHSVRGGAGGVSLREVATFSHAPRDLIATVWPWGVGFGGPTYWGGLRQTDYPQYLGITVVVLAVLGGLGRRARSVPVRRRGPERSARRATRATRTAGRRERSPRAEAVKPDGARPSSLPHDRATIAMLVAVTLLAIVFSLGTSLGPLYALLHGSLPVFSSFRVAVAIMIVAQLALALLSARGFDRLRDRPPALGPPFWIAVAAAALIGVALAFGVGPLRDTYASVALAARPQLTTEAVGAAVRAAGLDLIARGLLVAGLVAALARLASARTATVAAIALLALDLGSVSAPRLRAATGPLERLAPPPPSPLARLVAAQPRTRGVALERDRFFSNDWISWRARAFSGLHGAVPRLWDELSARGALLQPSVLSAMAVRHLTLGPGIAFDSAAVERAGGDGAAPPVLRLRHAQPRAYAVAGVTALTTDDQVLGALLGSGFDPAATAFTTEAGAAGDYPGSRGCRLRWIEDEPDRLALQIDAPARAFLVIADAWFPGWKATLDGSAVPIARVNHMARGVAVPAGSHRVRMTYEPEGWRAGMALSRAALGLGAIAALALAWIGLRERRRGLSRGPSPPSP
jgi:hypothetical protein